MFVDVKVEVVGTVTVVETVEVLLMVVVDVYVYDKVFETCWWRKS